MDTYNNVIKKIIRESIKSTIGYHGSNADFDNFDLAYVNTGSKFQDYGYGVYLFLIDNDVSAYGKNKYVVEIPSNASMYLDADKILTKGFTNKAIQALYKYIIQTQPDSYTDPITRREFLQELQVSFQETDGLTFYGTIESYLGSDKETSEFIYNKLKKIGLKYMLNGKYPCAVMFNPKDIKIIKKDIA